MEFPPFIELGKMNNARFYFCLQCDYKITSEWLWIILIQEMDFRTSTKKKKNKRRKNKIIFACTTGNS